MICFHFFDYVLLLEAQAAGAKIIAAFEANEGNMEATKAAVSLFCIIINHGSCSFRIY